jgi:hypothetical protein
LSFGILLDLFFQALLSGDVYEVNKYSRYLTLKNPGKKQGSRSYLAGFYS